jgi:tRNA(Ser,Leu) C12 N-acetylase TAN1
LQLLDLPTSYRIFFVHVPLFGQCYASVEEIKAVSISLLKRCLPNIQAILPNNGKEITFKLEIKRRLCTHLTREQVIDAVTPVVMGGLGMPGHKFSVNLSDPDFSIRIETCRTLCGISILPREGWYKNFNLAELNNPTSAEKVDV